METQQRKLYLRFLRRRAYEAETAPTPKRVDALRVHGPFTQAVESVTGFREKEAADVAAHILESEDPLVAFSEIARYVPISVLNYLLANHDMGYFGKRYFPHIFDAPYSKHLHGRLFPLLYRATHSMIRSPIVIAGWRECGKSVCASMLAPIHANVFPAEIFYADGRVVNMAKEYIMFLSLVKGGARKALRAVQYEYETNEAIRRDFGEYYLIDGRKPELWNKSEFMSPTGVYHEAMSRFTSLRGARERHRRPDFPIVDDVEDARLSENSVDRRVDDMNWFTKEFLPSVSTTKGTPIMLGNFPYIGCMSQRLAKYGAENGWEVLVFRLKEIIDGVEDYTWRERFGPEFEKKTKRDLMFEASWQTEYQLNPGAAHAELQESDCKGYDLQWLLSERMRHCRIYFALDPAIGMSKTADKTAIVPIARDITGKRYVLPIIHERGLELDAIVSAFVGQYVKYYPRVSRMGVEAVGFQRTLKTNIEEAFARQGMGGVRVHAIQQGSREEKRGRIRRTWPSIKRGDIYFLVEDEQHRELIHQIVNEHSDHDDAADAFEMADRLIIDEAVEDAKNRVEGSVRVRTLSKAGLSQKEKNDNGKASKGRSAEAM